MRLPHPAQTDSPMSDANPVIVRLLPSVLFEQVKQIDRDRAAKDDVSSGIANCEVRNLIPAGVGLGVSGQRSGELGAEGLPRGRHIGERAVLVEPAALRRLAVR